MGQELLEKLEDMGAEVEDTLERLQGDQEMYLEYLYKLPDNQNIVNLRACIERGDTEQAMKEVHTLKGIALNLGLLSLADACMDMLLDFRAGKIEAGMAQLPTLEENFNEWVAAIKSCRA